MRRYKKAPDFLHYLLMLALLGLLGNSPAMGQAEAVTSETMTPILGSGHEYLGNLNEMVDPADGSLTIRINVPTPPGRGPRPPFSFAYDSRSVFMLGGPPTALLTQAGWSYLLPLVSWETFGVKSGIQTCTDYSAYLFKDSAGTLHQSHLFHRNGGSSMCSVTDFNSSIAQPSFWATKVGVLSLISFADADGTIYQASQNPAHDTFGGPSLRLVDNIEDRNGNQTAIKDLSGTTGVLGSFSVTDTIGRPILASSGFGTSGNTVSVYGFQSPYTVTWAAQNQNFSSTWTLVSPPGIYQCAPFGPVNDTLKAINVIQLPNSQSYTFQYDQSFGAVNKIIYPAGGWVTYQWGWERQAFAASIRDAGGIQDCGYIYDKPAIVSRTVSFDGITPALKQDFQYSTTWSGFYWTSKQTIVTAHDLIRGNSFQTVYNYVPSPTSTEFNDGPPPDVHPKSVDKIPVEQSIVYYADLGSTVVRTVNKT